jgi:hypothetical protein
VKFILKCFEANYPESLGILLIHNAPWIFSGKHLELPLANMFNDLGNFKVSGKLFEDGWIPTSRPRSISRTM